MNKWICQSSVALALVISSTGCSAGKDKKAINVEEPWQKEISAELEKIDDRFEGKLGVYVKRVSDGKDVSHLADDKWYLASTVKVLVAASLLSEVEKGRFQLSDKVKLSKSDFVDGSGEVMGKKPGTSLSLNYLLEKMLTQSDSTATDILIRKIGVNEFNQFVQTHAAGMGQMTTILDVRYEAYKEIHPAATKLSNLDFIALKKVPPKKRLSLFAKKVGAKPSQLHLRSVDEAFERYYQRGLNSGSLEVFGSFIEKLLGGKILNAQHTTLLNRHMESAVTGEGRIESGLPKGFRFAQKTGTQSNRLCNVGVITPPQNGSKVVVTACLRDFKNYKQGLAVLKQVGESLGRSTIWASKRS